MAEAVDRLLQVADDKKAGAGGTADDGQELVLLIVRVLKLVNEYFGKA